MKLTLARLLPWLLLPVALAAPPVAEQEIFEEESEEGIYDEVYEDDVLDQPPGTIFNGQTVPQMIELNGTTLKDEISTGFWLVEAFSPYCHHCKSLAPKWQTLYEFYYTSDPVPASNEPIDPDSSLNSFSRYYNFKFAKLDCVAFGTACSVDMNVQSFPTLVLFKDGEEIKRSEGDKSMAKLSRFVEDSLEVIRPGSRDPEGVKLPKVGADSAPPQVVKSTVGTEKSREATTRLSTTKSSGDSTEDELDAELKARSRPSATVATSSVSTRVPNVQGVSLLLDAEKFQKLVAKTIDPWWIKFYAPWCHHCQKMEHSWKAMAREMKGRLNIGEVNCEVEKRLCRDVRANSFPTIVYFKGPERMDYEGLRGMGDFISYAEKAIEATSGVREVNATEFEALELTNEVIFTYFYDEATTSEDFEALERFPVHLIGRAILVKTQDRQLIRRFKIATWPQLLVARGGKPTYYSGLAPNHMRDVPRVVNWMHSVWLPLVPEITAANAKELMDRKFVVLGILNRDRTDEFTSAKREIKNAAIEWMEKQSQAFVHERQELRDAKQLRIEEAEDRKDQRALRDAKLIRINMDEIERKGVRFAWLDGVFWERWIRTTFGISSADGDKVIIYDQENRRYWDTTITGNAIVPSRTSILETLPKVVASPPKISAKIIGSSISHFIFRVRSASEGHPWWTGGSIVFLLLTILIIYGRARRRRVPGKGLFPVNEKEGLLGLSHSNGKAD